MSQLVVASHNLMRGTHLDALAAHHRTLRAEVGLDVLCLQESRLHADGLVGARKLAAALGDWANVIDGDPVHGVALVYDRARLRLVRQEVFLLPRHHEMSLFEERILLDDRPPQIHALLVTFEPERGEPLSLVNFHLDTVGGTPHRRAQVDAIARRLQEDGLRSRVVVCGDTNAFAFSERRQQGTLSHILGPLAAMGIRDAADVRAATHWFARQEEPGWLHFVVRGLARMGLDIPSRYDVICTDLPTLGHGRVETIESDHDLVWAAVSLVNSQTKSAVAGSS